MQVSFRQGLIKYQTDIANNPTFLRRDVDGSDVFIDLIVSPDTTLVTFADGAEDYLHEERTTFPRAWGTPGGSLDPFNGPLVIGVDYWCYIDIDVKTGLRKFGVTTYAPIVSANEPLSPAQDQHWFDTRIGALEMKVRVGNRWSRRVRVFACKLEAGAVIKAEPTGTQVNLNVPVRAGFILFDDDDEPVQKAGQFNRQKFLTTDSPLASQFTGSANFRLESLITTAKSAQNLPKFTCVRITGDLQISAADPIFVDDACVGLINDPATIGSVNRIVATGQLKDQNFNFTEPAGTCLFVGSNGALTSVPSQQFSIQQVARIVSSDIILVDLGPHIRYA